MFDGIIKGWGKDRRALVKMEKANVVLERENSLLKEQLRQLEQNQPKQTKNQ
jgi:hypothetical protein